MPSVNDNDLDKLFREAVDRNVPEFDPQDWEDMARRLEHEERSATLRSKSLYALLLLLLVNAFLPPWGQRENIQSASFFETRESTDVPAQVSPGNELNPVQESVNNFIEDGQESSENEEDDQQKSIRIINTLRQSEKANRDINNNGVSKSAVEKIPSVNRNKPSTPLTQTVNSVETRVANIGFSEGDATGVSKTEHIIESSRAVNVSGDDGFSKGVDVAKISSLDSLPPYEQSDLMATVPYGDSLIKPVEQIETNLGPPPTVIKPDRRTSQRWFIKIPVSPDFSAIDYADLGDPGINIGLLGEYNVTANLSVSTGAIWSKKLYYLENPDKSYSSGNWTGKASMLDGDCRVLDIPINFTYYLFPQRRTNLFVSVGSSSYIMLKEQYVYTVWANHKEYQYEETFSHENNEWFSMLNLSIGVQQRLGKRFFAQAEPFLKAPMSGVGEGKVNLMSTGIFFSLKYSLNK